MNVLVHGDSLWCSLDLYKGRNDIRLLGFTGAPHHHYRYDPLCESASDVIERVSKQWTPELLLCWYPEVTPPPFAIEECPVQTAAVISDWNLAYALLEKNLTRFDVVLCDKPGVTVFRRNGVNAHHPFPIYSQDSRVHHPYPVEKDIDVVMVGNLNHAAHATRARYLERLAKLSDQYRIVIATNFVGEAYGMLLSRARIVFNHSIRSELNMRFFETLACGSLAFLEESNSEVGDWCRDGHEVVLYNSRISRRSCTTISPTPTRLRP